MNEALPVQTTWAKAGVNRGLPESFEPVLARLAADSSQLFGCAGAQLEPVEYHERLFSYVLRLSVTANAGDVLAHVFVKVFKVQPNDAALEQMRSRVVKDFENTSEIHRALSTSPDLGAVRPVACYPEHLAIVTEEVTGKTLLDYLHCRATWVPGGRTWPDVSAMMERAGRWVHEFQSTDRHRGQLFVPAIRDYVDLRLQRLVAAPHSGFDERVRARVLEHLESLGAAAAGADLAETIVHADLAPANMIVSGERLVVLDFAMCGRGSIYHDLSRLFLQVDLLRLKPQFRRSTVDRLCQSLLRGFDSALTRTRPAFRLLLLQHRINHLATLTLRSERFPKSLYNWHVRQYHWSMLETELQASATSHAVGALRASHSANQGNSERASASVRERREHPRQAGPARILEVTSYPPPRAGWGMRVEFLKKRLERQGHECVVLNIGSSRRIPSSEYETVMNGLDFARKVWRYSRRGFTVHAHANGDSVIGLMLALGAELLNLGSRRRCYLTFHAGVIQRYFPRHKSWLLTPVFWLLFTIPRRIICNSDAVKACIARYGIDSRKIAAIPAFSREYLEFTRVSLPDDLDVFCSRWPVVVFSYVRMRTLFYPTTLVDGMASVMAERPDVGLVICGGLGHSDPGVWPSVQAAIRRHHLENRIHFVDDLEHDAFLTMLERSSVYLRTPITDGVASSVLEALSLGVPVVAAENGTRPAEVVTYPADDSDLMAQAVMATLGRRLQRRLLSNTEIADTVSEEVQLLTA